MPRPSDSRLLFATAAAVLLACAPVSGAWARRREPVAEAPPPPPAPANQVSLPQRLVAEAAAYQAYLERVSATSPAFTSGLGVSHALKDAVAYEPKALIRGAVAYGAIAALEEPSFVAALRAAGNTPDNRRLMVGYISADVGYALLFKGADGAAGLAKEALGSAGLKLMATGKTIKLSAYEIQHQDWSKQDVADRSGRLAAVEAEGQSPLPAADDHVEALQRAASGTSPLPITAAPAAPPYTPLVARAIQLAAIAALGEAGDDTYDRLALLASDDTTDSCLHIAKLNLNQCLAVAKPNYEDVFCMGQHAMTDTGTCLVRNAGVDMPIEVKPPAPAETPAAVKKPRPRRGRG